MVISCMNYKGGTGKSLLAKAIMEYLLRACETKLHLLDVDKANRGDVAAAFSNDMDKVDIKAFQLIDMDDFNRFLKLVVDVEQKGETLVINTGAASDSEYEKFGKAQGKVCEKLGVDFRTMWVCDSDATCIDQLKKYISDTNGAAKITVVKNLDKGSEADFNKIMPPDQIFGLPSIFFPVLPNMLRQKLKRPDNLPFHRLEGAMDICEYFLVEEYIDKALDVAKQAVEIAKKPLVQ